jgi:hypothetical protein
VWLPIELLLLDIVCARTWRGEFCLNPKAAVIKLPGYQQRFLAFIVIVKSLKQNKTNLMGNFLISPLSLSRSGVLRQGFDKFYSLSFQARLSFFVTFKNL